MSKKVPVIATECSVQGVFCADEFSQLTQKEKEYCYRFSKASWQGTITNYFHRSYESPAFLIIFQLIFTAQNQNLQQYKEAALKVISQKEYEQIMVYCASFLANCGNFLSFGDCKFVPEASQEAFYKFIQVSANYEPHKDLIDDLWNEIKEPVYSYEGQYHKIGFPGIGSTGYYSNNMTREEIDLVDDCLQILNKDPINTRLFKIKDQHFQVLTPSITPSTVTHYYKGNRIDLVNGDFSVFMTRVAKQLEEAVEFAANPTQKQMLKKYYEHFVTGDIEAHKDSQRLWIQDKSPILETNIGFIESYLDPKQVRAEFEGFISLVNKKESEITNSFVQRAPEFLKMLPWPKEFEKDQFIKPDFTCLSVLTFGSSGAPLGINIPNYDDIRMEEGFKNVYLGNCLGRMKITSMQYLSENDKKLLEELQKPMSFHKIVFHELLGHGCGKLLYKDNFDENLIDPTTGKPVASYYKEKEGWMSVFQNLSNPMEECRADSVALYFACIPESVDVLQPQFKDRWQDLCYVQYLSYIYGAVQGLEFYTPSQNKWGQAHINGRWVITQVLLEAGNGLLSIKKVKNSEGKDTIEIKLDYNQILTTGKEAITKFLLKLNVYKATANLEEGRKMYQGYSAVSQEFLEIRDIVLANKKPRRIELQGNLFKDSEGNIEYRTYDETHEGVVQSFRERYPIFDSEILNQFRQHQHLYKYVNPSL